MSGDIVTRLSEVVRIYAEGASEKEALARLADHYSAHGWPAESLSCAFTPVQGAPASSEAERGFLLYQLRNLDAALPIDLRPSGLPVVGRLVDALKRPFHQLVIYYVTDALARVGTAQMIQARLIESLQTELAQARRQLAAAGGRAGDLGTEKER